MKQGLPPIPPVPPVRPVRPVAPVNPLDRFFGITSIRSDELLPAALLALGKPINHPGFLLVGNLRMRSDKAGGVIEVPDGFFSDLASIPQLVQGIFLENDDPRISAGAWIHDYLCVMQGKITLEDGRSIILTHTQAAKILAEAMASLGANIFQINAVFEAVNNFGPQF